MHRCREGEVCLTFVGGSSCSLVGQLLGHLSHCYYHMASVSGCFPCCTCVCWCYESEKEGVSQFAPGRSHFYAYVEEFNNLARYAPNDVNTDAARQEKFLEGLNDELSL